MLPNYGELKQFLHLVSKNLSKGKDLLDKKYSFAQPITFNGEMFWLRFKNQEENRLLDYL